VAAVRAVFGAVGRLASERWLIDLLMLALITLLIGVTALWGLAVVSTWTPTLNPRTANGPMLGDDGVDVRTVGRRPTVVQGDAVMASVALAERSKSVGHGLRPPLSPSDRTSEPLNLNWAEGGR